MLPATPNAPPAIENVPPIMLTGTAVLMPLMTTAAESIGVESATLVCGVNPNKLGVVNALKVVTVKVAATPPMVTVALTGVAAFAEDNTRTMMV